MRTRLADRAVAHFTADLPVQPQLLGLCNNGTSKAWRN
jgi:hypothetical protein